MRVVLIGALGNFGARICSWLLRSARTARQTENVVCLANMALLIYIAMDDERVLLGERIGRGLSDLSREGRNDCASTRSETVSEFDVRQGSLVALSL
jgi:hypothetical protein